VLATFNIEYLTIPVAISTARFRTFVIHGDELIGWMQWADRAKIVTL
jgi:hypothetical protein